MRTEHTLSKIHFINAGAGSGKTTKLVELICDHLLNENETEKCRADEFILTTFTKAAANEFKSRIVERLTQDPKGRKQISSIDTALIGTIDSICERYLRKYWYLLDLSPAAKLFESEIDQQRVVNVLLESIVTPADFKVFIDFSQIFQLPKDDVFFWKEDILKLTDLISSYRIPKDKWQENITYGIDVMKEIFKKRMVNKKKLCVLLDRAYSFYEKECEDKRSRTSGMKSLMESRQVLVNDLIPQAELDKAIKKYSECKSKYLELYDFSDLVDFLNQIVPAEFQTEEVISSAITCYKLVCDKAWILSEKIDAYKKDHQYLDFSDLETKFLRLLEEPDVVQEIQSSIKYIFVDEFQDCNPIQLEIFSRLSVLVDQSYWVGDPKQAIYGFRGTDSTLLFRKLDEERRNNPNFTQGNNTTSYRSFPQLVNYANVLFSHAFSKEVLAEKDSILADQIVLEPCVDMKIAQEVYSEHLREQGSSLHCLQHWNLNASNAQKRYVVLAEKVKRMLEDGYEIVDRNQHIRKLTPKDIAVLTPENESCKLMAEAFRLKGIPVSVLNDQLEEQVEIRFVYACLKYVYHIDKKLALAEIYALTCKRERKDLLLADLFRDASTEALTNLLEQESPGLYRVIDQMAHMASSLSIKYALSGLISGLDLNHYCQRWGDSANRIANLQTLVDLSVQFEERGREAALTDFFHFVEEADLRVVIDKQSDTVKILTYHASKGLEWPVVLLDGLHRDYLGTDFFKKDFVGSTVLHRDEDSLVWYIPKISSFLKYLPAAIADTTKAKLAADLLRSKVKAEKIHLLYVAFTRARNILVILSSEGKEMTWWNLLDQPQFLAKNALCEELSEPAVEEEEVVPMDVPSATYVSVLSPKKEVPEVLFVPRKLNPSKASKLGKSRTLKAELTRNFNRHVDMSRMPKSVSDADRGTCIHNFMAVYTWKGKSAVSSCRDLNVRKAQRLLENYAMAEHVSPSELVDAADDFYGYLEEVYGTDLTFEREVPFRHYLEDGRFVDGEIDLLVTIGREKGKSSYVIVDYKNVREAKEDLEKHTEAYFSQLMYYKAAVEAVESGASVKEMYIYYPTLGVVEKVK